MTTLPDKIILAGFMGTGKSAVGRLLAKKLGYGLLDTDELVEELSGKSISTLFETEGEAAFRKWEQRALHQALAHSSMVISVGGGAVCSRQNLDKIKSAGPVVLLRADVKTILKRIAGEHHRPLLRVQNPETKILQLMAKRARHYQQIPWQIQTDGLKISEVVQRIYQQIPLEAGALRVRLGERSYPIFFCREGVRALPGLIQQYSPTERVILVTNSTLNRPYGGKIKKILEKQFKVHKVVLPDGEKYKTLKTVQGLYGELVRFKADRKTPLLALGGGVLGDVVGFAAASYLRGVPFIQIPTTLLAQVDSSIGGKTGVDLPEGKNLVGAFYQPRFVLIDEKFLSTLPEKEFKCGMAEVIKYGAIFDAKLFTQLEKSMDSLLNSGGRGMEPIIRRCCELKGWVVEKDERETLGLRSKLNFGHTFGHAIESLTGYKKYTHGEAIAMGMDFAAQKSVEKTGLKPQAARRLKQLLEKAGLPTKLPPFKKREYLKVITQDKKRVSGRVNFVYLNKIGKSAVIPTPLEELL